MKHLFYLNKFFLKYKFRFLLGILFVALSNIFGVFPPQVIRYAFDLVKENIAHYKLFDGFELQASYYSVFSSILLFFGVAVLALAIMKGIFLFLMRQTIVVMSRLIEFDLRNEIYDHYQSLSTSFFKRNKTGDLMSRVTEDVNRVRMYLGPAIMYGINLIVLFIMVIGTMLKVNAELTFYVLLPLPILSISIYYVNTLINRRSEAIQRQLSTLTSTAQEAFSGIRVLKAYVQEDNFNNYFSEESESYKEKSLNLVKVNAVFFPLILLLVGISTIITIYVGGIAVMNGKFTAGNIAEFVLYVNMLTWPVTSLGWVASIIQRAAASQERINEFLAVESEIISGDKEVSTFDGALAFKNVSFTYPDTGIKALKNINFSLRPGQSMAIIGKTGSGKTTIADLLLRKYVIDSGVIEIDDQDITEFKLIDLRREIGYVPQDVFLFSDTVEKNIAFGVKDPDREEVIRAAKGAAVYKDINGLSEGMLTMVGERGVTLSGGQKQRISLARALIKKPSIILLDDCLSAVDANTEQIILEYLNSYLSGKTAIIITHRIFSLIDFDHIIVLEDGEIIEQGKHEELLSLNGNYAALYTQQLEEREKKTT